METWMPIREFPGYEVSSMGYVRRPSRDQLSLSVTRDGTVKVLMSVNGKQYTRSVRRLVAEHFCSKPSELFDTPINLDGNPNHNWATNIAWRPRWFAWEYSHQFAVSPPDGWHTAVRNISTFEIFGNVMDAAMRYGQLCKDIYTSVVTGKPVFPDGHVYEAL